MRLSWICDVALLTNRLTVPDDWIALQERSVLWCARQAVEHSLKLAVLFFNTIIPEEFNDFVKWPQPSVVEKKAWRIYVHNYPRPFGLLKLHFTEFKDYILFFKCIKTLLFPSRRYIQRAYGGTGGTIVQAYGKRLKKWFLRALNK